MYLFQISNYDNPAVDRETAELLHQRLETESRRRCRIYGVFLPALGLLTLILGLMPPKTTAVIIVGGAVIIAGLLEFTLARGRTPPRIPASCKKGDTESVGVAAPEKGPEGRERRQLPL